MAQVDLWSKKVVFVHMQQSGICDLVSSPLILEPGIARGTAGPTTAARFFKFFKAVVLTARHR